MLLFVRLLSSAAETAAPEVCSHVRLCLGPFMLCSMLCPLGPFTTSVLLGRFSTSGTATVQRIGIRVTPSQPEVESDEIILVS